MVECTQTHAQLFYLMGKPQNNISDLKDWRGRKGYRKLFPGSSRVSNICAFHLRYFLEMKTQW